MHEKKQERQWRIEGRDLQMHRDLEFADVPRPSSSMQPLEQHGSAPIQAEEAQLQGWPMETVPVEDSACLKAIYPEGLERIKQRSMLSKSEPKIKRLQTIGPASAAPTAELFSPDARAGTPQLKLRGHASESRHQIILGLENADLRDTYHNGTSKRTGTSFPQQARASQKRKGKIKSLPGGKSLQHDPKQAAKLQDQRLMDRAEACHSNLGRLSPRLGRKRPGASGMTHLVVVPAKIVGKVQNLQACPPRWMRGCRITGVTLLLRQQKRTLASSLQSEESLPKLTLKQAFSKFWHIKQ
ncbi:uncharacterized protein LOC142356339 [Convolutriloba macropyga]|uniref:uncharacterized protein LOC142356339 n=1 Tax=Convolutriloba macropyga TaxID=536237 RepID=UPI003F5271DD